MNEIEAQKWLERFEWDDSEETSDALGTICEALQEYPKFKAIGTIERFRELTEKAEPKKMLYNAVNWYRCPNGCEVQKKHFEKDYYCPKCGQRLDWE